MALMGNISLNNGLEITGAHLIIDNIHMNYSANDEYVLIHILIYKDCDCYNSGKPEVIAMNFKCDSTDFLTYFAESVLTLAGNTPLGQAYSWLKMLTQFSNMVEV